MSKRHAPRGRLKARPTDHPMEAVNPMEARCKATNRAGRQCGKPPIVGGTVCRMHGGAAPQVAQKAKERLAMLVNPAIDRMAQLITQTDYPSVAYQASKDVLDRELGKAGETVAVNLKASVAELSDEELAAKALALLGVSRAGD